MTDRRCHCVGEMEVFTIKQKVRMEGKGIYIIHPYNENEFLNVYETHLTHAIRLRHPG